MDFCFAFRSTDAGLLGVALEPFAAAIRLEDGAPFGWGMGYYQSGQPLLRKQPKTHTDPLDYREKAKNLKATLVLGHRRARPVGAQATGNTHPFRFRSWLFSHCGKIEHFADFSEELLGAVPDFIRRNIRGATDSEHLFHLFLAFLNDTGKLDDPRISGEVVGRALASTVRYVDRMAKGSSEHCCLVTNGEILVATHRGIPLSVARHAAYRDVARTPDDKPISYPHLRSVILVGGKAQSDSGWEAVPDGGIVVVDSDLNIEYSTPADDL